jgi:hypothetical protein
LRGGIRLAFPVSVSTSLLCSGLPGTTERLGRAGAMS